MLWPGFHVPCRSLLVPNTFLFKFLQEDSQGEHSLRPFWKPRLRSVSSYKVVKVSQGTWFSQLITSLVWHKMQSEGKSIEGSAGWLKTFFLSRLHGHNCSCPCPFPVSPPSSPHRGAPLTAFLCPCSMQTVSFSWWKMQPTETVNVW